MRRIVLPLAFALLASSAAADEGRHRCGDVNRDGRTDVLDVIQTLRAVTGVAPFTDSQDRECADLAPLEELETWNGARVVRNVGDNALDVSDVVAALRITVGLDRLNNCAPLPTITRTYPSYDGTFANGAATASVRGQRLIPDTGAPLVSVRGVPAAFVRAERGATEDAVWFLVPQLDLTSTPEWLDVHVLTMAGPVTAFSSLEARESCAFLYGYPSVTPVEAERQLTVQAQIGGDRVSSLTAVRLVGHVTGRVVELTKLDPLSSGTVLAEIPAQPQVDAEAYDLVVDTPCGTLTKQSAWHWYRPDTPDVTSVSPNVGPAEGGLEVRLTGTNLDAMTGVWVGDQGLTPLYGAVRILSPTEAVIPSLPASVIRSATRTVAILAMNHGYTDGTPVGFTYVGSGVPRCDSVSPTSGPWTDGTQVTIRGAALSAVMRVDFQYCSAAVTHPDPLTLVLTTRASNLPTTSTVKLVYDGGEVATCPGTFTFNP